MSNLSVDIHNTNAAVSGGTQGIGAATAVKFAELGANVFIVGRNPERGASVVDQCKQAAQKHEKSAGKFEFIQGDLSTISGLKDVAKKLESKSGGSLDFLVMTQGGPPPPRFELTADGIEQHFATQVLSRFALPELLARSKTLNHGSSVVLVAAPGPWARSLEGNGDDLQLRSRWLPANASSSSSNPTPVQPGNIFSKLATMAAGGSRDSVVLDSVSYSLAKRHADINLHVTHLFPGLVHTNAASNQSLPWPLPTLSSVAGKLARTLPFFPGRLPEGAADGVIREALRGREEGVQGKGEASFKYVNGWNMGGSPWAGKSEENRRKVWTNLSKLLGEEPGDGPL